jgi:hypothetical protein
MQNYAIPKKQKFASDAAINVTIFVLILAALVALVYQSVGAPEVGICQDMKQYQIEHLIHDKADVYYKDCSRFRSK